MSNKQKFWTWVFVIIAVVIVLVVLFGKKQAGSPSNTGGNTSGSNKSSAITGQTTADKYGVDTSAPPITIQGSQFNVGDKIYAGEDFLNAYDSCPPTSQNIYSAFNKGDYIGTYVSTDSHCLVVSTRVYLLGYIPTYSKDVYLFDSSKVYKG